MRTIESRFSRLFGIVSYLSPHSQVSLADLALEFGVSVRTIRRDLSVLQEAKLGITYDGIAVKITTVGYRKIKSWIYATC
jgi:DeoR/GlpR family transcriptional regulator of sugar metabolism